MQLFREGKKDYLQFDIIIGKVAMIKFFEWLICIIKEYGIKKER